LTQIAEGDFLKVKTIGIAAFNQCGALASASFPAVTTIDNTAFMNCAKLASVSIPAATTVTGADSFSGVGTNAGVTVFTITIGANCTYNDDSTPDDLHGPFPNQWSAAFKTVYDGSTIGGAKAGGTYTYTKADSTWRYTAP
jgi:hypothetical protein